MNNGNFLYIWLAHHILFIAAMVLRRFRPIDAVTLADGELVYTPLYYYARKAFTILATVLVVYMVVRLGSGWRLHNWWTEGIVVLCTLTLGHITFLMPRYPADFTDAYKRRAHIYIPFVVLFFTSFYVRLVLAVLSMFSYSGAFADRILPDVRGNDLHLLGNYYLCVSGAEGILVEQKVFLFSRNVSDLMTFRRSMCNFDAYDFRDADDLSVPFPYVQRMPGMVRVVTNPTQKKAYIEVTEDSSGGLRMSAYVYGMTDIEIQPAYMPCGIIHVK